MENTRIGLVSILEISPTYLPELNFMYLLYILNLKVASELVISKPEE